jgi:hypothetical protein
MKAKTLNSKGILKNKEQTLIEWARFLQTIYKYLEISEMILNLIYL